MNKPPIKNLRTFNISILSFSIIFFLSAFYFSGLEGAVAFIRLFLLSGAFFVMVLFIAYKLAGAKVAIAVAVLMGYIVVPLVMELRVELPVFYANVALTPITAYFGLRGDDFDRKMALLANELFLAYVVLLIASYLLGLAPPSA
ncbi:hypothetical protein CGL51_06140 [Pyrobaculum aerophilum]|uniref:Uncharacterized protein n=2 Tax=Pyrobaculum aerophilum TaxID=13773 RepID=A0A371QWI6_9CREN|nr:hypothetical protein CGL52_14045 [Pyrobaculum aerophilum]RFA96101.1 hypothetical protein CGL51_06140 [Pyrobaculum aerophilum]